GSVNWARLVVAPFLLTPNQQEQPDVVIQKLIDNAPELTITDSFQYLWDNPLQHLSRATTIPALAIPVETKTGNPFECPKDHLDALREFLPQTTKILIIGWRAAICVTPTAIGIRLSQVRRSNTKAVSAARSLLICPDQ